MLNECEPAELSGLLELCFYTRGQADELFGPLFTAGKGKYRQRQD